MTTFTPGPWRRNKPPHERNGIYGIDKVDGSKQLVADIYGHTHKQIEDNARLIAAAPDMYEALEHAQRALAMVLETDDQSRPTPREAARQCIAAELKVKMVRAKVEGKKP